MVNMTLRWEDELTRGLSRSWIVWVTRRGGGCVRFMLQG